MENKKRGWLYVALGLVMFICLGTVYAWSIFRGPLEMAFQVGATESGLPYMVSLACYALWMFLTGPFVEKYPPKIIMSIGALLVGGGWILASYSTHIEQVILTYGVMGGSGVGILYGVPIAVVSKWCTKQKGLAVGIMLAGFGVSPLVTAPLASMLIEQVGPFITFRILGIAFLGILIILAQFFRFPLTEERVVSKAPIQALFVHKQFYGLWICFMLGTLMGLMAVGITTPVAMEIVQLTEPKTLSVLIALFAGCNGIGRPLFGWLTDRLGPMKTAILSYGMMSMASLFMLLGGRGSILVYAVSFCVIWMTLGSWLAIAPVATGKYFGTQHQTRYYGIIFTAYGVGALMGVPLSGITRDYFGSYTYSFYQMLIISIIGIILAWRFLKEPCTVQKISVYKKLGYMTSGK